MSRKFLLCFFVTVIILAGCHKDNNDPVKISPTPVAFGIASVLQSNMVLQRDKPTQLWGQATPGNKITIKTSWNTNTLQAITDESGQWKVTLPATAANSQPQTVTCSTSGTDAIVLDNILIGDVWLCSGQSNMVMPIDAIAPFTGVLDYAAEIAAANYPAIRILTVKENSQAKPAIALAYNERWSICTPQTAGATSAVAYYFARKLHTTLNVPIGIIISAINGSWCESWINQEAFKNYPGINDYASGETVSRYYNGMINPLINMQIKGFIWYQGENNQHDLPANYTNINSALIKSWRDIFKQPDLPFYLTQLTPFAEDYNTTTPPGGSLTDSWLAYFREAQANVLTVPNTGMAITMDVGEAANHHPRNKKPVGERLALLALKNTYQQNVICDGPKYASYTLNGNTATITFLNNTASGLNTINSQPLNQLFFVAGADMIVKRGTAAI
jgi:sialate O-acetylesterase